MINQWPAVGKDTELPLYRSQQALTLVPTSVLIVDTSIN